tara:strand:+ start:382 stop:1071 length:690 start_codon:yes stop_codon:yes gene_type:complete
MDNLPPTPPTSSTPSISFDTGISLPVDLTPEELSDTLERAKVACQTALALEEIGVDIEPTEDDKEDARQVFTGEKNVSVALTNSAVAKHLAALLTEYDKQVVQSSAQLRTYITNKLIEESNSTESRTRMRALELLGKITDVGLFTERTEVTIKQQSTEELEKKLQEKLKVVMDAEYETVEESTDTPKIPFVEPVDIDEVLGDLSTEKAVEGLSPSDQRKILRPKPVEID